MDYSTFFFSKPLLFVVWNMQLGLTIIKHYCAITLGYLTIRFTSYRLNAERLKPKYGTFERRIRGVFTLNSKGLNAERKTGKN